MPNIKIERKRLRSCSASVLIATRDDGEKMCLLQSYGSYVMEAHFCADTNGWEITPLPRWNYSTTTQQHVRKFLEDYVGVQISVQTFRDALKYCETPDSHFGAACIHAQRVPDWHLRKDVMILGKRWQPSVRAFWRTQGYSSAIWGF